ncbi:MAG: hypothetical protein GYB68_05890 [Chloroflexi bacterium]|nr:hypothetical protein [Chloroflexota bacterium]
MARPAPTTISCPNCGQPFSAMLEQVLDVDRDPGAKDRLLNGRVNVITCPHCGYRGMVGTPLIYHDSTKPVAVIYVPMELNLNQPDREKLVGDLTNALMRNMDENTPKGHLLQPKTALTFQGLMDQVLEAEGLTQEEYQQQQQSGAASLDESKLQLIEQIAEAKKADREALLAENMDQIDMAFVELLTAAAQQAAQAEDQRRSLRLLNAREYILEHSDIGQQIREQEAAFAEANEDLQGLLAELQQQGRQLTREDFVDLLMEDRHNEAKVRALASLGRQLLDYQTFEVITARINMAQSDAERQRRSRVRELALEAASSYEREQRAEMERAAETLRQLMQAEDIALAVRDNINRIDDLFLQVLQVNLDEARRSGNMAASGRLAQIYEEVLRLVQESAPPEIRFINELLSAESNDEVNGLLHANDKKLDLQLLGAIEEVMQQFQSSGNQEAVRRLDNIRHQIEHILVDKANETIEILLASDDIPTAVDFHQKRIDELFLQVLQQRLVQDHDDRLREVREAVVAHLQSSAPPELRMINDLLSAETEDAALDMLRDRRSELSSELLQVMEAVVQQLRAGGSPAMAQRLEVLRAEAQRMM